MTQAKSIAPMGRSYENQGPQANPHRPLNPTPKSAYTTPPSARPT